MNNNKNLCWIDTVRAICMVFVFLAHSCAYYGFESGYLSRFFSPFYVNAFFIVSGYLFFRKAFEMQESMVLADIGRKLMGNAVFRLFIPTVLFSGVLLLPKCIFNSRGISWSLFAHDILGGTSFWFTSTLFSAQVILLLLLLFCRKSFGRYLLCAVVLFMSALWLKQYHNSPFPWFWKSGMGCVLFLTAGGLLWKFEDKIDALFHKKLVLAVLIGLLALYYFSPMQLSHSLMGINFDIVGLLVTLGASLLLIIISKLCGTNAILKYVGRNSITFYYTCGLFPALFSTAAKLGLPKEIRGGTLSV